MRESETYKMLLREMNESKDHGATQPDGEDFDGYDSLEHDQSGGSDSLDAAGKRLLDEAGERLRSVANHMSLVLASDGSVLLTGDASLSAMAKALETEPGFYSVVVTPHHGGERYVPLAVKNKTLSSQVWVSSAGGRLSSNVSDRYDVLPGLHFRTDEHHDVDLLVTQHSVHAINTGFRPRHFDHPFYPMYMR